MAKNNFSLEFKLNAVSFTEKQDQPIEASALQLGISLNTLKHWLYLAKKGRLPGYSSPSALPENQEIKRLKKDLERLKMENEILKKATAFFARDLL